MLFLEEEKMLFAQRPPPGMFFLSRFVLCAHIRQILGTLESSHGPMAYKILGTSQGHTSKLKSLFSPRYSPMADLLRPSPLNRKLATASEVDWTRSFSRRNSIPRFGSMLNFLRPGRRFGQLDHYVNSPLISFFFLFANQFFCRCHRRSVRESLIAAVNF